MKNNYSTMNTMQCFSSNNSISNSSKDSKQMFLTTRRGGGEPLIPASNYLQNHHLQNTNHHLNQSVLLQNQSSLQNNNYPCVHPHHTVLSSSCSPSISSNSINIWTSINNSNVKQSTNDKVPQYSALSRFNTLHHNNSHLNTTNLHNLNKPDDHLKQQQSSIRWRTNEKKFCFLLLVIGCILTFILLIFSLIFYFIVFKHGSFGVDLNNKNSTAISTINSNLINNNQLQLNKLNHPNLRPPLLLEKTATRNRRRRLINKIDGELRILNKPFKPKAYDEEISLIKQNLNYFIQHDLNLCLNNTEITKYRRGDNHDLNGIIVNFILSFDCALPNLAKRLAFSLRDSFKNGYSIDYRTLRLTPIYELHDKIEFVDVAESDSDGWLKYAKNSKWGDWSEWSNCNCTDKLVVRSRQRMCLNKITNKLEYSFSCGNSDDESDEHLPSVEIRNCDCDLSFGYVNLRSINNNNNNSQLPISSSSISNESSLQLAICMKCEKTTEICLSYNNVHTPNCLKKLNYEDKCGGHCNSKGTDCKYFKDKNMYQCLHVNETTSSIATTGNLDGNVCLDDEFKCADGLCIPLIKVCDSVSNCFDSSDEHDCTPSSCDTESGEYMHCGNSTTTCIHISKRCDYELDCVNGFDEAECFQNCPLEDEPNSNQFFHCLTGTKECIKIEKYNNGIRDCKDGSDEI